MVKSTRSEIRIDLIGLYTEVGDQCELGQDDESAEDADDVGEGSGDHPIGETKDKIKVDRLGDGAGEAACDRRCFEVKGHAEDVLGLAKVVDEEQAVGDTSRDGVP